MGNGLSKNATGYPRDYLYWLKYNFSNLLKLYDGTDGYLVFRPWPGGFNNIRMSLELAAVFAYLKNRTLVLPPTYHMYLLKGESNLADYFDLDDIGIETVDFEEFLGVNNHQDLVMAENIMRNRLRNIS